jgi:hypothetical protein
MEGLEKVREEFHEKAKSQEECFIAKLKELKKELQDAGSSLDKVTRAKGLAASEVTWL